MLTQTSSPNMDRVNKLAVTKEAFLDVASICCDGVSICKLLFFETE